MKKQFYLFSLLSILFCTMLPAVADGKTDRISRVKAAFILNIARYVEWPNNSANELPKNFQLCFYQKNPLGTAIHTIRHKRIGKKRLDVQYLKSLSGSTNCKLLYLTQAQMAQIADDMKGLSPQEIKQRYRILYDKNLLTMGDLSDKRSRTEKIDGVIICLIRQSTRIGIEINMSSLTNSKLKVSSELLKLSKRN